MFARLRRLNADIAGEDTGLVVFEFASGGQGLWDANRYNESPATDPRYTFGEFVLEGDGGSMRLDEEGRMSVHPLGAGACAHRTSTSDAGSPATACTRRCSILSTVFSPVRAFETGRPLTTCRRSRCRRRSMSRRRLVCLSQSRRFQIGSSRSVVRGFSPATVAQGFSACHMNSEATHA